MSVTSGYDKYKRYQKLSDGTYKLVSQWTSSNTVHFDDGNTAQSKVGAINGITDSLTATSSAVALSAAAGKSLQDQIINASKAITTHVHTGESIEPNHIDLIPSTNATNGGYIDFHYGGSTGDYTSRIVETASGKIEILAPVYVSVTKIATSSSYACGVNTNSYNNAPIVINAAYNSNDTLRAGCGFHNLGLNGAFLYLGTDGKFNYITNNGADRSILDSSNFSLSGTTLNITI